MTVVQGDIYIEYMALSELQRWPRNPKDHDLGGIGVSFGRFGYVSPVLIDERSQRLVAGHGRLDSLDQERKAGKEPPKRIKVIQGEWYLPVVRGVAFASDAEAEAYLIADNKLTELGGWIDEALAAMLTDIQAADPALFAATGFDDDDLGALRDALGAGDGGGSDPGSKIDQAEELQAKWQVQAGDLFQLGPHRLLCGDSTNADDVRRLMAGKRACLFATDPPYLVDYDGTNHPHKWNEPDKNKDWGDTYHDWDDAKQGEGLYDGFITVAIQEAITEDAAWYCWHASRNQKMVETIWEKHGAFVHQQIIWVKDRPILTRSWYMWQHEPCFMGWVKPHKPKRVAEDYPSGVWQFPTLAPGTSSIHPTEKPVDLFLIPIRQHTHRGDLCFEPFCGSGSQMAAAEQEGRICYALEREPKFCAAILERLSLMSLEPVRDEPVKG